MKLTAQMQGVLDRIARAGHPPFHTLAPQAARAAYLSAAEILDLPRAPLPRVEDLQIAARDGHPLAARLYAPSADAGLPVLLYLHGGGFTIGGLETHDSLCRQLALLSGAAVLSLDYRLAPEWRFPTAFDDSIDALLWLAAQATSLGLDATRIAIGGDSAGGTLAAATAIHVARHGGPRLALQLLFYPGCGALEATASYRLYGHGYLLDIATIEWFFEQTIDRHQRHDPRWLLLEAEVEGVAPAWIGLAECDPLADSAVAFGDRLRAAGVPVQLEIWRGVVHDFIKMGRAIAQARLAHAAAAQALKEAFSR
jgi:acetyl esterase